METYYIVTQFKNTNEILNGCLIKITWLGNGAFGGSGLLNEEPGKA